MRKLFVLSLALCIIAVSGVAQSKKAVVARTTTPVVDITKSYPEKEIPLKDVATVEYIPLETSNTVLLDALVGRWLSVTDKYIVTCNHEEGRIFVFGRNGKILHTFNHRGESGEEYIYPKQLRIDEKAKEIYVLDLRDFVQVYSLDGKFKRTLAIPKGVHTDLMYNYDDQWLLCYDNFNLDKGKETNNRPYFLLSKKDGSISRLNLTIKDRIGNRFYVEIDGRKGVVSMNIYPMVKNGSEAILADLVSNAVYSYKKGKLVPLVIRTPLASTEEPRLILTSYAKTGDYLHLSAVKKLFEKESNSFPIKSFIYNVVTGETSDLSFMDSDFSPARPLNVTNEMVELPDDFTYNMYDADRLIEWNNKGRLTGKLKEIASKMTEDDNPVLVLYKFKKAK